MEKKFLVFLSVLTSITSSGCLFSSSATSVDIVAVYTPDNPYKFGEYFEASIEIKASHSLNNVTVNITGLKNRIGQMKLQISKSVNLEEGVNIIAMGTYLPYCSPCAKLESGSHNITVLITYRSEMLSQYQTSIVVQ